MLLGCGAIAAAPAPAPAAPAMTPAVTPPVPPSASSAGSAGSAATLEPTSAASAATAPDPTTATSGAAVEPSSTASTTASADPTSSDVAAADGAAGVARRALARLDVTVSGTPRIFDTVLPAQLTDANHGFKAAVCRDGGYDLDAVAGRAVTFVGYDAACNAGPRIAWAVVRGDAVACIYLSCTERDSAAPGIWPARSCRE